MRQAIANILNMLRKNCAGTSVLRSGIGFLRHLAGYKTEPYYSKVSQQTQLCIPRDTRDIIAAAGRALDKIWKKDITMQRRESCSTISVPAELPSYRYLMKEVVCKQ